MTVPREVIVERVKQWIKHASDDLRAGRHLLTLSQPPLHLAAFHAQQAAEKALKAYLVNRLIDFPLTHRIGALLALCARFGDWPDSLDDANVLTQYAVTVRYPGIGVKLTEEETQRALDLAAAVLRAVSIALNDEGIDISTASFSLE